MRGVRLPHSLLTLRQDRFQAILSAAYLRHGGNVVSEQEPSSKVPSELIYWWVQLCRRLWHVLRWVWGTLIAGIVITAIANLSTTTIDTPLAKFYIVHLALTYSTEVYSILGFLAVISLLSLLGSREKQSSLTPPLSKQEGSHRQKQITLNKVEKLVPGVDISHYQDIFGKPTFINHNSFFMNPNDEMRKFVEYVFIDEYFYLDIIANSEGKVLFFAITIRDKSFNPTFKNSVFQVQLGISKYTDIPGTPRAAQGCYGANWFAYYETRYYGRPGAYQDFGFGFNTAGYADANSVQAYRGLLDTKHNCQGTLSDQEIEQVKVLSADAVFNTYAVSAPNIQITDYAYIILGVNYDQVRILDP